MSEIQGSGGIRPQSESHEVQERGEQENVPETLRNARVGQSVGHIIGRIILGIFTLGISEGILAIIRAVRAATPEETPTSRLNNEQRQENTVANDPSLQSDETPLSLEDTINPRVDEERTELGVSQQDSNSVSEAPTREASGIFSDNHSTNLQSVINECRMLLNVGVPLDEILANLRRNPETSSYINALRAELGDDHGNVVQSSGRQGTIGSQDSTVESVQRVPSYQPGVGADRRIASPSDLVDFIKDMAFSQPGRSRYISQGLASDGSQARLYHYNGFAFRSDQRRPEELIPLGMKSQQPLEVQKYRQESQGLDFTSGAGATGKSGVSMAKDLDGCVAYYTRGGIYIIDTRQLGDGQYAYDLQEIIDSTSHREVDTGKEVNATDVPYRAIVGWITLPQALCENVVDEPNNTKKINMLLSYIERKPQYVGLNPQYQPLVE
ncbi:hypothetical protein [uncultured Succinatimonas sp.]|uniref:hypothetical protein n=1 Tax=uncultured Succinatimonas sp. TaxID=1262973 RepID=UPI0025E34838|nr:hypothetical protein [uncultured Succinatimonas sp.]